MMKMEGIERRGIEVAQKVVNFVRDGHIDPEDIEQQIGKELETFQEDEIFKLSFILVDEIDGNLDDPGDSHLVGSTNPYDFCKETAIAALAVQVRNDLDVLD